MVARMLGAWLGHYKRLVLVGSAPDGLQGLQLCLEQRPDVVLLDVMMPEMDGLTLAAFLLEKMPELKIIILSARLDPYCSYRIQQLGIPGYVDKASPPEELIKAVFAVAYGGSYKSARGEELWQKLCKDDKAFFKVLTEREINLLHLLARGNDLHEAAAAMEISYDTARTHQRNIRNKLGIHSSAELLRFAKRNGLF
jgi:DNA-binding NarL/FixJ family response regulator